MKKDGKWLFDSAAGVTEILYRRIGTNELDAIQVCHGYAEAQRQYALTIHDDSGVNQYAQKIISTPGKQDGLYWENADGTPGGPVSEPVAKALAEGYTLEKNTAYHGYYYKILKGQGPAAPLGKLDYVIQGAMIGGFALVAVPADTGLRGQDLHRGPGGNRLSKGPWAEIRSRSRKTWSSTTRIKPGRRQTISGRLIWISPPQRCSELEAR